MTTHDPEPALLISYSISSAALSVYWSRSLLLLKICSKNATRQVSIRLQEGKVGISEKLVAELIHDSWRDQYWIWVSALCTSVRWWSSNVMFSGLSLRHFRGTTLHEYGIRVHTGQWIQMWWFFQYCGMVNGPPYTKPVKVIKSCLDGRRNWSLRISRTHARWCYGMHQMKSWSSLLVSIIKCTNAQGGAMRT